MAEKSGRGVGGSVHRFPLGRLAKDAVEEVFELVICRVYKSSLVDGAHVGSDFRARTLKRLNDPVGLAVHNVVGELAEPSLLGASPLARDRGAAAAGLRRPGIARLEPDGIPGALGSGVGRGRSRGCARLTRRAERAAFGMCGARRILRLRQSGDLPPISLVAAV